MAQGGVEEEAEGGGQGGLPVSAIVSAVLCPPLVFCICIFLASAIPCAHFCALVFNAKDMLHTSLQTLLSFSPLHNIPSVDIPQLTQIIFNG